MKVYVACYDSDKTMRSKPEPEKVFLSKEKAKLYLKETYDVKDYKHRWEADWCVLEFEVCE